MPRPKKVALQQEAQEAKEVVAELPPVNTLNPHKQKLEALHKLLVEEGIYSREQLEIMLTKL